MCLYANTLLKCPSLCPLKRSGRKREEKREKWKECSQCNQNSLLCIEAQTVAPCAKGVPTQLWYGNPRTNRAITARTEARHLHNHSALPSGTQIKRGREGDQERERERERDREREGARERESEGEGERESERGRGRERQRERERESGRKRERTVQTMWKNFTISACPSFDMSSGCRQNKWWHLFEKIVSENSYKIT